MTDTAHQQALHPTSDSIELLVLRDPDGPLEIQLLIDGVPYTATEFIVDSGAGWTSDEWAEKRDADLSMASDAARTILLQWYACPPGSQYVTDM
ncbi:hypothetical protein [Nocardia miyunensis]|uniref:hypothetical protein n=1 Tax=Nocardia miyunensis TaxID=282684 RepID=UPI0008303539|nr:hypothetical protein [Nocardia miyunensis]